MSVTVYYPTVKTKNFIGQLKIEVDPEDLDLVLGFNVAITSKGYLRFTVKGTKFLHDKILSRMGVERKKGCCADHNDRNKLNNTRNNLNFVTYSRSNINRKLPNKSTFRGVKFISSRNNWIAQIKYNGVSYHLGTFDSPLDAAKAYDLKAKELHGEHAQLNFSSPRDLFIACEKEAEKIRIKVKEQYPNSESIMAFGGDPPAPQVGETTANQLAAYVKHLPELLQVTASQIGPTERAKYESSKEISPLIADLNAMLFSKYAPQLSAVGRGITADDKRAAVDTEAQILETSGPRIANAYDSLSRLIDPEFYQTKAATAKGLQRLNDSISLDDSLTGGERAEIERAAAAQGSERGATGVKSATEVASNASRFGSASANKLRMQQEQLGRALSLATSFMPNARSGFDPVQAALGRPSINTGPSQFTGVQPVGTEAFSMGNNFLGEIGQTARQENDINSKRRSGLDMFNETFSAVGSVLGGII